MPHFLDSVFTGVFKQQIMKLHLLEPLYKKTSGKVYQKF
jgi:hypothetical protein